MMKLSSLFWVILVSATALATFAVKYEVQALDDRLADIRKATAAQDRELRVLGAEWAYLNRPDMLAAMNQRFLGLAPITRKQLETAITEIPMRPAPPPPVAAPSAAATGPVAALDAGAPEPALPAASAALDRPAGPDKLAMASAPIKPLLVKAMVAPDAPMPPARPLAGRPDDERPRGSRPLDSRSLDRLIARIAAGR